MIARWTIVCAVAIALAPSAASAQDGRVAVTLGGGWGGAASLGARDATLTAADGSPFTLFTTETRIERAPFVTASVGVGVSRLLDVEVRGSYGRPSLSTRVTHDAEGADDAVAAEPVHEFTVAAVAVIHPGAWHFGSRGSWFASGGAGYLRHLHGGGGYAAGGRLYLAGGGLIYRLGGGSGWVKATGLRVDAGVSVRAGAAALDHVSVAPLAGAAFYVRF